MDPDFEPLPAFSFTPLRPMLSFVRARKYSNIWEDENIIGSVHIFILVDCVGIEPALPLARFPRRV